MSCSITLKQISYKNSSNRLFENVNLNVGHEEKVAIVGANGVGKSTLIRIIAGLEHSYEGILELFHNKIDSKKEYKKFRSDVGYLPQDVNDYFLCPVVIEDVMFNLRARGVDKEQAYCEALKILESLEISHLKDRTIFELSGGEQKIVAIASILSTKPKILLLDEPTNALDINAEKRIVDILNGIKKSMIIVSHHKTFIDKLAPTVYTLNSTGLELN
ncbi:ABC transporter ATP-binding protein [Malaciobacter halophilus]|nr:ABC transporter ATP-binding protein [Malaciobacter halophilus]RYA24835.1 ABC transporter ATP-binding protein [Malaciobacter halophilus]